MFKKTLLSLACALALGAVAAPALASTKFFLVVPLSRATTPEAPSDPITVSLAGAALPKATVNTAYSHSLQDYLAVTGDTALDKSAARWSLAEGALPAGLALDATTGAVAGTPTAKTTTPASFTVLSSYKGSDGQAVYSIEVGGVVLMARQIAVGANHTCAITAVGGVKCWGAGNYGQLGNSRTVDSPTPVDVIGLSAGVANISSTMDHTCVLTSAGGVKCWGYGALGQLGNDSRASSSTPVAVLGLDSGVAAISAGGYHTCAIITAGGLKCWGANGDGQAGDNTWLQTLTPVDVLGLSAGVKGVSSGAYHTCAVTTSGAAKCWGANHMGQLGDDSSSKQPAPVDVVGLSSGVLSVSAGYHHSCAVTSSGAAKCWGLNEYGQLGDNSIAQRATPVDVFGLGSGVSSIEGGNSHTCAVTTGGAAKCWGYNNFGQLGDNSSTTVSTPVDVAGLSEGVKSISASGVHTCAVTASGAAKCWGYNNRGQLGDGSTSPSLTPTEVIDAQ